MTSIATLLRRPRTSRIAALVLLTYFAAEWIVSASWRGNFEYTWTRSGELGIPYCGLGDVPCSTIYPLMNVGMIITGLAVVVIAASWRALGWAPVPAASALVISGGGLTAAGLIAESDSYRLHVTAMNVFFVFGAGALLLIGVSAATRLPGSGRSVLLVAGAVAAVAYFAYSGGIVGWLGPGGTERAIVYSLLIGLLIAGLRGAAQIPGAELPAADTAASDVAVSEAPVPEAAVSEADRTEESV